MTTYKFANGQYGYLTVMDVLSSIHSASMPIFINRKKDNRSDVTITSGNVYNLKRNKDISNKIVEDTMIDEKLNYTSGLDEIILIIYVKN